MDVLNLRDECCLLFKQVDSRWTRYLHEQPNAVVDAQTGCGIAALQSGRPCDGSPPMTPREHSCSLTILCVEHIK